MTKTTWWENHTRQVWEEYDAAAKWCAQREIDGQPNSPLPALTSIAVCDLIEGDVEAFQKRIREFAYAIAAERNPVIL